MDNITENGNKVFDDLGNLFHSLSKSKGFWEDTDSIESILLQIHSGTSKMSDGKDISILQEKREVISDLVITQKLALIASEAGEAINAHRKQGFTNKSALERWCAENMVDDPGFFEEYIKDNIEDELADVVIRIFDFCERYDINLYKHIFAKHKYNSTREHKHGSKY